MASCAIIAHKRIYWIKLSQLRKFHVRYIVDLYILLLLTSELPDKSNNYIRKMWRIKKKREKEKVSLANGGDSLSCCSVVSPWYNGAITRPSQDPALRRSTGSPWRFLSQEAAPMKMSRIENVLRFCDISKIDNRTYRAHGTHRSVTWLVKK